MALEIRIAVRCNTLPHNATRRITLQRNATNCNILQRTATKQVDSDGNGYLNSEELSLVSFVCNTMHHTAMDCNTRQHSTTHCNSLQPTATKNISGAFFNVMLLFMCGSLSNVRHTATIRKTHCNVLQHCAAQTCRKTLQHIHMPQHTTTHTFKTLKQTATGKQTATHYNTYTCRNTLQHIHYNTQHTAHTLKHIHMPQHTTPHKRACFPFPLYPT